MHASAFFAAMAIVHAFPVAAATPPPQLHVGDAIAFSRAQLNPDGTTRSSRLWVKVPMTNPRALTPDADHEETSAASWSPGGTRLAFQRTHSTSDPNGHSTIFTVGANGSGLGQATTGRGNFLTPAWGPANTIAFVERFHGRDCLSVVNVDSHRQRELFCAPAPAEMARPVWSADGRSILIHAGYYTGSLEPLWRSLVYRIDAGTGAPFLLGDRVLDEPRFLEFSPDGSRGIYSDVYTTEMMELDFASGAMTSIGYGYAPRWAPNGRRIAFTREYFDYSGPEFRYYEPLYVVDADGANERRITLSRLADHAYTAVDWSADGRRLLVNRRIYLDPSLTITRFSLRMVDVDTRAVTNLTDGRADPGAWFEH
mgnify:CR=1 FL=1